MLLAFLVYLRKDANAFSFQIGLRMNLVTQTVPRNTAAQELRKVFSYNIQNQVSDS